jgi:glycine dehydrogenase
VQALSQLFRNGITDIGFAPIPGAYFGTVALSTAPIRAAFVQDHFADRGYNIRNIGSCEVSVSFDETHTESDIYNLINEFKVIAQSERSWESSHAGEGEKVSQTVDGLVEASFRREKPFLTQDIFNSITTEMEMSRYIARLEKKDLSLTTSMISLGSCTMKLNSVSSLVPVTWSKNANMHPFAPREQTAGYNWILHELERYCCDVTDLDACSLQPASG